METYMEESHLPFAITMDTHQVVLRIKHRGKDLFLNKKSIHLHSPPVGFVFKLLKAIISFKVKHTWKPVLEII
jgi:hypothetical protein